MLRTSPASYPPILLFAIACSWCPGCLLVQVKFMWDLSKWTLNPWSSTSIFAGMDVLYEAVHWVCCLYWLEYKFVASPILPMLLFFVVLLTIIWTIFQCALWGIHLWMLGLQLRSDRQLWPMLDFQVLLLCSHPLFEPYSWIQWHWLHGSGDFLMFEASYNLSRLL